MNKQLRQLLKSKHRGTILVIRSTTGGLIIKRELENIITNPTIKIELQSSLPYKKGRVRLIFISSKLFSQNSPELKKFKNRKNPPEIVVIAPHECFFSELRSPPHSEMIDHYFNTSAFYFKKDLDEKRKELKSILSSYFTICR